MSPESNEGLPADSKKAEPSGKGPRWPQFNPKTQAFEWFYPDTGTYEPIEVPEEKPKETPPENPRETKSGNKGPRWTQTNPKTGDIEWYYPDTKTYEKIDINEGKQQA